MSAPVRPAIGARMVAYCSCTLAFSTAARSAASVPSSAATTARDGVALLARDNATLHQILVALHDHFRVRRLRRIPFEIGGGLLQGRFEWPSVEREELLPGLDVFTLAGS